MYQGVMGLPATILKSKNDGVTRVRVAHDDLSKYALEFGKDAAETLKGLGAEVEVLYRSDAEYPLAEAHAVVLRGYGLTAMAGRV